MPESNSDYTGHTAFECPDCGYDIRPGDDRVPTTDGAIHRTCSVIRDARDVYSFFISNPVREDAVGFGLFYDAGEREYPILYNTGGMDAFASASKFFGDDTRIRPTKSFFRAIGYTYHWLQSYRPLPNDVDRIHREIEKEIHDHYPNGKIPVHEEWALYRIITQLYQAPAVQPEWKPIIDYCETITAFQVPNIVPYTEESR